MIKMFCDICGKELAQDCEDTVNLDFHSFGVSGFEVRLEKYKPLADELNLCVDCAEKVVSSIEDLRKIAKMEQKDGDGE